MSSAVRTATTLLAVGLLLGGCSGVTEESRTARPAASAEIVACAEAFNRERAADLGSHAYSEHAARQARVHRIEEGCAVVFVVPESDLEFGAVGEVQRPDGWVSLAELGSRAPDLQRAASGAVNADVRSSGSVLLR